MGVWRVLVLMPSFSHMDVRSLGGVPVSPASSSASSAFVGNEATAVVPRPRRSRRSERKRRRRRGVDGRATIGGGGPPSSPSLVGSAAAAVLSFVVFFSSDAVGCRAATNMSSLAASLSFGGGIAARRFLLLFPRTVVPVASPSPSAAAASSGRLRSASAASTAAFAPIAVPPFPPSAVAPFGTAAARATSTTLRTGGASPPFDRTEAPVRGRGARRRRHRIDSFDGGVGRRRRSTTGAVRGSIRELRAREEEAGGGGDAIRTSSSSSSVASSSFRPPPWGNEERDDFDDDDDDISFDDEDPPPLVSDFASHESPSDGGDDVDWSRYPPGKPEGFRIVRSYSVPFPDGFDLAAFEASIGKEDVERLHLEPANVTLPAALTMLDPEAYPSLSRARKACRKGTILLHRGPILESATAFDPKRCERGRVGDRVYPGDVVAKQVRMGNGFYPSLNYAKPPFDLPVVYEDDHFAIVNKPAGVVVYSHRKGGHGRNTVRAALPFALKPPKPGTVDIVRRPTACHRLDKPTSGLLLVAKTKPAMVDITRQFVERSVRKTYAAVVNGVPDEPIETSLSSSEARELGVDVPDEDGATSSPPPSSPWQIIDKPLDGKSAVTVWRALRYAKCLVADQGIVTLVELKPKTGRFHQLRRHMAWVRERPLVGDPIYDGGGDAMKLRGRGLFLCSNKIRLEHPYYNTDAGKREWDARRKEEEENGRNDGDGRASVRLCDEGTGRVMVHAEIDLPDKFGSFLDGSERRAEKFTSSTD